MGFSSPERRREYAREWRQKRRDEYFAEELLQVAEQYTAFWSVEDNEWVGVCSVFPSLSWLAPTQAEARKGIADLVATVRSEMAQSGE